MSNDLIDEISVTGQRIATFLINFSMSYFFWIYIKFCIVQQGCMPHFILKQEKKNELRAERQEEIFFLHKIR